METQQTTQHTETDRLNLLDALTKHVNKRTGMNCRDYGMGIEGWKAFRTEYNQVLRDGKDARALINFIASRPMLFNAELLFSNSDRSDRLTYTKTLQEWEYCVGQYWPTEYRSSVCRWGRDVITQAYRAEGYDYPAIKKQVTGYLGRGIVKRWFY